MPDIDILPEPDTDTPHIVGVSSVATELEGVPTSTDAYDQFSGRNKLNVETPFMENKFNNLKDTHATMYQDRHTTCSCGCLSECAPGKIGPSSAKFAVPLSLAVCHYIVMEIEEKTGCVINSLEDVCHLVTSTAAQKDQVQSAVRAVMEFLPCGEYTGRLENEALKDKARPTDKWVYVPTIARAKRPLCGISSDKPAEALSALAVHCSKCVKRVFPRSFRFSDTDFKLDISTQINSSCDLIELVKVTVGDVFDTLLKRIVRFSMEHSKTSVDYRNSVFAMYTDALPQSKHYPTHILDNKKQKARDLIESIPSRLGELVCDAAFHSPLLKSNGGDKDHRGWVSHRLLRKDVEDTMERAFTCTPGAMQRMVDALRTGQESRGSDGQGYLTTTKVGFQGLKSLFEAKLNAGNMALLIAHKLVREEALMYLPRGTESRDADGYPIPITLRGVAPEFFDADAVATGITDFTIVTRVYGTGGCYSESSVVRQDLPYNRVPRPDDQDSAKESKTHRCKDFGGKVVSATWMLSNPDEVEAILKSRPRWLTRALPGRTLKWNELGCHAQTRYTRWSLAFLDGYLFFRHPEWRVIFDPISAVPNTPLCQEWGKKSGPHGTAICQSKIVTVGLNPPSVAVLRHHQVLPAVPALSLRVTDTTRTKKKIISSIINPLISRSRSTSGEAIFAITRRSSWNAQDMDAMRERVAHDRVSKCYSNLRRTKIPSPELSEWCRLHPDVLFHLEETHDLTYKFYWSGLCSETLPAMVHADLLLSALSACGEIKKRGRTEAVDNTVRPERIDCQTGFAILESMVGEFTPLQDAHRAKFQKSCGGNGISRPVTFGVGCGLKDDTLVEFSASWDETWRLEKRYLSDGMASRQVALNSIWVSGTCGGEDCARKVSKTAQLCKQVVCARFGPHSSKPMYYEEEWGTWKPEQDIFLQSLEKRFSPQVVDEMNGKFISPTGD
jgi:hypothetical protein